MDLDVVFVGTAGSAPTPARGLPALLVRRGGDRLLFDCGEGTQRQLLRSVGLVDLEEVFVTHFHADHVLGLPGMLKTFSLRGRDRPLTVYGPRGLGDLFAVLRPVIGRLPFELSLVELEPNQELRRDGYRIAAFETEHGVTAYGYAIVEDERLGRFDERQAIELGVRPGPDFGRLHRGETVSGRAGPVRPEQVVGPSRPGRKVVIAGDTAPAPMTALAAHGADLLVHEATFGDEEVDRARETAHSTARQAAELASEAGVKLLALTHVSQRYAGPDLRDEARSAFANTIVPRDFDRVEIPFAERGEPVHVKVG
ncbi:MAG: ribonuclease Z [Thermoleophilaceae bacterium]